MKILVTGGAGFIGSNFIHYILNKYPDYKVINLDLLTYAGNLENLKAVADNLNYQFIKGDICDVELVDELVKKVDVIVHFAAESHVDRSVKNSADFIRTNVLGTHVLLDVALRNGGKRFHHVSTDEVFGHLGPYDPAFNEKTPYNPRSPYSASKASSDFLVNSYFHTHKLPITISNCSNNYGPYQFLEKVIPLFVTNLIEGKRVPLYGDGSNIRDWLHVEDHCRAIDVILHNGKIGQTYCIGGNQELSNLDLTMKILNAFNVGEEMINYVEDRLGHDWRYAIDFSKIKRELGWEPERNFESGLSETIEWYKNNKEWWQKLKGGVVEIQTKPIEEDLVPLKKVLTGFDIKRTNNVIARSLDAVETTWQSRPSILIVGAKGMLGQELVKKFQEKYEVYAWDREEINITDKNQIQEKIKNLKPEIIINSAAYNAVDKAEEEKELADNLNGYAPGFLAEIAKEIDSILVHYSTDYIFPGTKIMGYDEDDFPGPESSYGKSKIMGEVKVMKNTDKYYIIRLSKLFGNTGSSELCKKGFIDIMLELAKNREELDIVNQELSSPTYAPDLAEFTFRLIEEKKPFGVYHGANTGACTWFEFAREAFKIKNISIKTNPITGDKFPRPAKRPNFSILLNTKLPQQRSWQEALREYLTCSHCERSEAIPSRLPRRLAGSSQ